MNKKQSKFKQGMQNLHQFMSKWSTKIAEALINFFRNYHFIIMLVVVTVAVLIAKIATIPMSSGDSYWHLSPWVTYIRDFGNLKSLDKIPISTVFFGNQRYPYGHDVLSGIDVFAGYELEYANYPVFYFTLLALVSYLPISNLAVIKLVSYAFDFLMAFGTLMILRHFKKSKPIQLLGYAGALILPTFFINSSMWGQSDVIYGALIVWCIYFLLKDKPIFASVFIGLSLSIKIQAVFIFPLLGWLWLKRKYKLWYLVIPFGVLFLTFIPNYLAGMPFKVPFEQYFSIASTYSQVNMNAGNIYALFEKINHRLNQSSVFGIPIVDAFGIPLALLSLIIFIYIIYYKGYEVNGHSILLVAAIITLFTPYVLPHMHERYFYLAEILIFIYILVIYPKKKRWYLIFLSQLSALITYSHFYLGEPLLFDSTRTGNIIAAIINAVVLILLISDLKLLSKDDEHLKKVLVDGELVDQNMIVDEEGPAELLEENN